MPITIDNPETERLARELAARTGESLDNAVSRAVRLRLDELTESKDRHGVDEDPEVLKRDLQAIADRCAAAAVHDHRSADEIIGYDDYGLPS